MKEGKIAFISDRDGNDEIYVMNADGTNLHRLTYDHAEDSYPTWSPDGRRIAFFSNRDGHTELYVLNADGTNERRLTYNSPNSPLCGNGPCWSPDGTKILFNREYMISSQHVYIDICVINADGTNERDLTNDSNSGDIWPNWSPDGTKIFFDSIHNNDSEIYVMDADGSNCRNLTNNFTYCWEPIVSPDGTKIAFLVNYDIYVMNTDGSNIRQLTNTSKSELLYPWSPSNRITFGISGEPNIYHER